MHYLSSLLEESLDHDRGSERQMQFLLSAATLAAMVTQRLRLGGDYDMTSHVLVRCLSSARLLTRHILNLIACNLHVCLELVQALNYLITPTTVRVNKPFD